MMIPKTSSHFASMVKRTKNSKRRSTSTVTIGRRGFAKISAIEGIKLSP